MNRKAALLTATICIVLLAFSLGNAADNAEGPKSGHQYVGAKVCKMCHMKDSTYVTWEKTKHASAWGSLKPEEQKKAECAGCHMTGVSDKGEQLTGVQCEVCHGPGSGYKKMAVMKDRKVAMESGLLMPDEKTCLKCHNDKVPEQFRSKEKFDFAKMKARGVHAIPVKTSTGGK